MGSSSTRIFALLLVNNNQMLKINITVKSPCEYLATRNHLVQNIRILFYKNKLKYFSAGSQKSLIMLKHMWLQAGALMFTINFSKQPLLTITNLVQVRKQTTVYV